MTVASAYSVSYGINRIVGGGTNDVIFVPRGGAVGKRVVILCHGATGAASNFLSGAQGSLQLGAQAVLAHALAAKGICMIALSHGNTFGNAAATAQVEAARAWAVSNLGCAQEANYIGMSMGHATALGHRRDYPTKSYGLIGLVPLCDLNGVYAANALGLQTAIAAAWSVTAPAALPANADPLSNAASLKGIKHSMYYSTADTVVLPATVTAMATAMGSELHTISGNPAHGDGAVVTIPIAEVAATLNAWGS